MKTVYKYEDFGLPAKVAKSFTDAEIRRRNSEYTDHAVWAQFNQFSTDDFSETDYPCHFYVVNGVRSGTTTIVNNFNHMCSASAVEYINWLLSEEGPYAALFTQDDTVLYRDEETGRPLCIMFTNVNERPIKLLTNFLIATRLQSGWALNHVWKYLTDIGFTKDSAILLSTLFSWNGQSITGSVHSDERHTEQAAAKFTLYGGGPHPGDQPFNTIYRRYSTIRTLSYLVPSLFCARKYNLGERITLKNGEVANPCNNIWDVVADNTDNSVATKLLGSTFKTAVPKNMGIIAGAINRQGKEEIPIDVVAVENILMWIV